MSLPNSPPPPPSLSSPPPENSTHPLRPQLLQPAGLLYKQKSWSPDAFREEAWLRKKGNHRHRRTRLSKSVTDEDLDELKGCIDLGFGFDSPEMDQRLSDTLPAYGFYYAVNKQYYGTVSKSDPSLSPLTSTASEGDTPSVGSPHTTIFEPGDNPQTVKTRLRQWAQVVACAVRQSSR